MEHKSTQSLVSEFPSSLGGIDQKSSRHFACEFDSNIDRHHLDFSFKLAGNSLIFTLLSNFFVNGRSRMSPWLCLLVQLSCV